jgi:peptide deformylase
MKIYKIIKNVRKLKDPCDTCQTVEEGERIGVILSATLEKSKDAVGLAANQIGIQKRVCLVNVKKPVLLINPEIIGKFDKFLYKEGCLSFPGEYIVTERYKNIMVKADNHKHPIQFSSGTSEDTLECACVQHEIDHLNGLLMFDRSPPLAQLSAADLLIRGLKNGE